MIRFEYDRAENDFVQALRPSETLRGLSTVEVDIRRVNHTGGRHAPFNEYAKKLKGIVMSRSKP